MAFLPYLAEKGVEKDTRDFSMVIGFFWLRTLKLDFFNLKKG